MIYRELKFLNLYKWEGEEDDAVYSRASWYGVILDLITALGQHYTVCVDALSMINSWLQLMREKEGDKKIDSILRSSFDFSISDDFDDDFDSLYSLHLANDGRQ